MATIAADGSAGTCTCCVLPGRVLCEHARFPHEFWVICLIVSLGLVESIPIGFYEFRLCDLILDLSLIYCLALAVGGRFSPSVLWLLAANLFVFGLRVALEADSLSDAGLLRTLFGMGAIFLTPFIFLAVRESRITGRMAWTLVILAWAVSLLSQLGLLRWGESYIDGYVDLAALFGITRAQPPDLDYVETTITVWRALSVGITISALLSRGGIMMKGCGLVAAILQFAGGGGGRSQLLFLAVCPLVVFLRPGSLRGCRGKIGPLGSRLLLAGSLSIALAGFYVWAPVGNTGPVHGRYDITHYERVTEIFTLFTDGWTAADAAGGFNARTTGYAEYWEGITSNPRVLWLGVGLAQGAAFAWTPNALAHNMVLDVWALSGLVGLVLFLCFIGLVLADLWALIRATPERGEAQLISLAIAIAVIYMFQWLLFQAATADRSFMIVFYLLAGLLRPTARWAAAQSGE